MIINMTGHDVTIVRDDNTKALVFPSMGNIRVNQTTIRAEGFIPSSYPISHTKYGVADMPEEAEDTYYIVSRIVRQAYPDRMDLLVPSELVYEQTPKGRYLIGCRSLDMKIK